MDNRMSIFLDALRFFSAFVVVLSHLSYEIFSADHLNFIRQFGHQAVIVFFVLSGYVIAYVADKKETTISEFYVARFSRLYSVILPVLIFVPILDAIGLSLRPDLYINKYESSDLVIRVISNLFFFQENWFYSFRYFSDAPLWSIGYEFWYYVLFSILIYVNGPKKYIFIFIALLFVGIKILLLFPIWLLGVFAYKFHGLRSIKESNAKIILYAVPFVFLLIAPLYPFLNDLYRIEIVDLGFSNRFLTDYITGVLVTLFIISFKYVNIIWINNMLANSEKFIRFCASRTFSLYLMHYPLLLFFSAILDIEHPNYLSVLFLLLLTVAASFAFSEFTEMKKHVYKKNILDIFKRSGIIKK